jgi:hypothetical protein
VSWRPENPHTDADSEWSYLLFCFGCPVLIA